jgi:hypothetical protein
LRRIDHVGRKPEQRQPDHRQHRDGYTTRKMADLIQIKVLLDSAGILIARGAGDEG